MKAKLHTIYLELANAAYAKPLRRVITLPFVLMLIASFALWYIAKLSYTYTTELDVKIKVEGQKIFTTCVVEGVGTHLVGYKIHHGAVNISLSDIKYKLEQQDGEEYVVLDQDMLNKIISVHYSDIKVISVEQAPMVEVNKRISKILAEGSEE
ncbi:MAG: hypothetical protein R3Y39_02470 [Rikenellaceae bacterium]